MCDYPPILRKVLLRENVCATKTNIFSYSPIRAIDLYHNFAVVKKQDKVYKPTRIKPNNNNA